MKILHALGWYFPESVGGTEVYVAALCRRMRAAGHDVSVAAPDAARTHAAHYDHDGVPVFRYPIPAAPTRDEAQGAVQARGAAAFIEHLRRARPDVVHVHSTGIGLGVLEAEAARAAGARVFYTAHESRLGYVCQRGDLLERGAVPCDGVCTPRRCAACALQQRGLPLRAARLVAALPVDWSRALRLPGRAGTALAMPSLIADNQRRQARLLAAVERFIVLTRAAHEIARANGAPPDKLALLRLGVGFPPSRKPDVPSRAPLTVGYLGRFDRVKGVHVLAAAVRRLAPATPLVVELCGPVKSDAERAVVADLHAILGRDGDGLGDDAAPVCVRFLPAVAAPDVPRLLARWDVLCCPSLCLEGGPTVALEAHAVGTPVIGSRTGGLAELVDDAWGALAPPGDAAALAAILVRVAEDPATIDRWRAHLPVPRTMDDVARDTLALYQAERA